MSVAGIFSSALSSIFTQGTQTRAQQFQQEFQQLGQDLQSGDLTAAQSDFSSLQQLRPQSSAVSSTSGFPQFTNPIAQAFSQLSQDLQSGNLSAAQQDYTTLQQDFQSPSPQLQGHHHHHHHHSASSNQQNPLVQAFGQLAQALQAGNTSAAQAAYSTLQQDLQQFAQANGLTSSQSTGSQPETSQPASTTLSVNV